MSLALKQQKTEINLFSSIVYHISFCAFLTLLVIHNAALGINIVVYVVGNTLTTLTKQFIMIAAERSERIVRWCLVFVDTLLFYAVDYLDEEQNNEKGSPEQNSLRTIFENATKRQNLKGSVKKGVAGIIAAPNPIVSVEIIEKSELARRKVNNKPTEASPASPILSMYADLALRKAEKNQLPLEQRSRPCVPSSLGQNRPKDWKPTKDSCPSKRHSTPASEKQKRTETMKFINSTASNRIMLRRKKRQDSDDQDEIRKQKKSSQKPVNNKPTQDKVKPDLKEKNLGLFDERPSLSQPVRTLNLNQSPKASLQISRQCLKFMIKVKKHRNTI